MRVDNSTGKGMSGMDKFSSEVHRVHMELGGKLLNSLRIETQFLERLQSVSVVDGAAHTQKDDVESNGGSLENVAEIFVLFLIIYKNKKINIGVVRSQSHFLPVDVFNFIHEQGRSFYFNHKKLSLPFQDSR
jgi:hypothetical protein